MGLPLEQWRGADEADGGGKEAAPSGCRTPQQQQARGGDAGGGCPAAPRKGRPAPGPVSLALQQQRRDYYNGDDVDAFFAAHNL